MSEIRDQILELKRQHGEKLLILGHHYQRSSVLQYSDEKGDSLELARKAGANKTAEKIVFCGVKFMAESADILSTDAQTVYMPETLAGCPMANMADAAEMERAWSDLSAHGEWLPVVYVNSTAEIKDCCGRLGGSTCTSSNSRKVFEWAFAQDKKVFFLPDEHLGWNTAHDMGISDDEVALYDPGQEKGGLTDEEMKKARVVVWKGFCIVHQAFKVEHVEAIRRNTPDAKILVHPETPKEVLRLCDWHGSTSQIIDYVASAEEGSTIIIGTELNLVDRLAEEYAGKLTIKALCPSVCANMAKINEQNLLDILQSFPVQNEIHVDESVAENARKALSRMLEI